MKWVSGRLVGQWEGGWVWVSWDGETITTWPTLSPSSHYTTLFSLLHSTLFSVPHSPPIVGGGWQWQGGRAVGEWASGRRMGQRASGPVGGEMGTERRVCQWEEVEATCNMLWSRCFALATDPHSPTLSLSHPLSTDPFHWLPPELGLNPRSSSKF